MRMYNSELEVFYKNTTQIGVLIIDETLFEATKNSTLPLNLKIDGATVPPTINSTGNLYL